MKADICVFYKLPDELKILTLVFKWCWHSSNGITRNDALLLLKGFVKLPSRAWDKNKDKLLDLGLMVEKLDTKSGVYRYSISDEANDFVRDIYISASGLYFKQKGNHLKEDLT